MTTKKRETRIFHLDSARLETRSEDGKETRVIVGHAAVFGSWSDDLGGFQERIAKGAFSESLKRPDDVRALFNHNADIVLGRSKSGTLRLKEDDVGLAIEIDAPDTSAGRDLMVLMERGDIDQMSFGFRTIRDEWEAVDGEPYPSKRTLLEVELFDVSPVTFPAYQDTDVAVRCMNDIKQRAISKVNTEIEYLRRSLDLAEASNF